MGAGARVSRRHRSLLSAAQRSAPLLAGAKRPRVRSDHGAGSHASRLDVPAPAGLPDPGPRRISGCGQHGRAARRTC